MRTSKATTVSTWKSMKGTWFTLCWGILRNWETRKGNFLWMWELRRKGKRQESSGERTVWIWISWLGIRVKKCCQVSEDSRKENWLFCTVETARFVNWRQVCSWGIGFTPSSLSKVHISYYLTEVSDLPKLGLTMISPQKNQEYLLNKSFSASEESSSSSE